MAKADLVEAAKILETVTGVPSAILSKKERQEQAARVKRFLALPPQLQEGCLKYAENIVQGYRK